MKVAVISRGSWSHDGPNLKRRGDDSEPDRDATKLLLTDVRELMAAER